MGDGQDGDSFLGWRKQSAVESQEAADDSEHQAVDWDE